MRPDQPASAGDSAPAGDSPPTNDSATGEPRDPPEAYPDVFLSYAREDGDRAAWAVRVLNDRGWSVWFDRRLVGGELWQKRIDETLDHVGCVVVLWSAASVDSTWVMDEAGEGLERGVLVPALVEDVAIPFGFRQVQAIDLVETRVPPDRAEKALVEAVAGVLGRPAIEPPKPSRPARLFRRWAALAAVMPLAFGVPILLRPVSGTVIDLSVTATEVGFVTARDQDLTDLMVVSALEADGLASIHLPRTRSADERVVRATDGRGLGLQLASAGASAPPGSITLESIRVPKGSQVMLAALDSHRLRITVSGSSQPIAMSVEGLLRTVMTGGNTELMDFGTPKPLTLEPDPRGAHVSFQRVADDRTLVSAPLLIDGLSLNRIDETLETTRTELAVVSTIVSGTVRFDAPVGPERTIGAGERLRFGDPGGEIRALELAGGNLRLRFQGRVRHMESCTSDDDCENWMPATFESLMARRRPWVLALGAAYILGVLALTRWRHGSSRRYLLFALAFGMGGTTRAHAQENLRLQDPEETVRQLVVRVESEVGFGSGIIVGTRSDTLFIVTANHVVRRGPVGADSVDVRFRWQPDGSVRATLLPNADDSLDLALLVVSPLSSVPPDPGARAGRAGIDIRFDGGALPFDRLGDLDALGRGDPIYLLGHPNGLPWRINTIPERFIGRRGESLDFESNLLARGHSGGALLNEDREVIGLLKSDQAPYGEAVSLYAIARRLEAWGYPVDLRLRAPQLEAGAGRTCVLTSRGETRCQGFDNRYESGPIEFEMRLEQLSITDDHACGIAAGGRAFCIGNNSNAQLGDGTTISRYDAPSEVAGGLIFETISAGSGHTCGLVPDGDVYCWGLAEGGQLGTWFDEDRPTPVRVPTTERFLSVSTSWQYSCGLAASGLAYCWGAVANASSNRGTPITRQAGDLGFVSLTTGTYQICGVATTGAAFCWGFNDDAQLGIGTVDDDFHEEPRPVSGNHSFKSISSGVSHTCGVTTDGDAWCWGLNRQGQLGNGSTDNSSVPVRVKGDLVFEKLSAGHLHTCGLTTDGTVWCWGDNEEGGVGPSGQPVHTEPYRVMNIPEDERRPWRQ